MAIWTHNICEWCWIEANPTREPVRVKEAEPAICCFCEKGNTDGIYIRQNPDDVPFCHCTED